MNNSFIYQIQNTEYMATTEKTIINESLRALNKLKFQLKTIGPYQVNQETLQ